MRIFVEGESDKIFIKFYLEHLNINDNYKITVVGEEDKKGGKDNIIHTNEIEKIEDKFLVIFDADDDLEAAKDNIKEQISNINSNAQYEIFLFPNNKDNGNLETLYVKIATNTKFIECFEKYKKCINQQLSNKSKIYAYLEACGLKTNYEKIKLDELRNAFNFEDDYLKPLKEFLEKNLGGAQ
ncbi:MULTISPECIES: DUF3226 domain-containing protein [unclassified Campylobacter]|uniref:DUF3226 domain-containing protein n=1 Tax=unclassified Campylobacter TaxID=2593542 RepID=UPI0022E9974F|nr:MULTISPECIES: DUF3226 domain-containing protein [unclassified Campylobacter]MDA3055888.1 hypothetical protein [Campylobacter sp. CN_NA1]MDA3065826.1 hypothetical protein [Campylobacter sp. CN_NE4]MDA3068744.1 hypothetical protein [Campylobacter sp. CN_NE3]MDA3081933.1 hypothetical protein [Campylobacter sp. CN_EL2]MDA3084329.1 hypothetical protein [Campylobacter sp. CN_NE1]